MDSSERFDRFRRGWIAINAAYESYARSSGLSYTQLQVLCELHGAEDDLTQKQLCELCHLPKTTVNSIVSGLVRQGHVELRGVADDRRQKAVHLTVTGRAFASPLMGRMGACELAAFEALPDDVADAMVEGVEQYGTGFNRMLNGEGEGE